MGAPDILLLLADIVPIVKSAKARGYQFTLSQTTDRLDISFWWDDAKVRPADPNQGIAQAFQRLPDNQSKEGGSQ